MCEDNEWDGKKKEANPDPNPSPNLGAVDIGVRWGLPRHAVGLPWSAVAVAAGVATVPPRACRAPPTACHGILCATPWDAVEICHGMPWVVPWRMPRNSQIVWNPLRDSYVADARACSAAATTVSLSVALFVDASSTPHVTWKYLTGSRCEERLHNGNADTCRCARGLGFTCLYTKSRFGPCNRSQLS